MLEEGRHPMDIVARDTGFADRDRMRRAFQRFFGHPPQTMRRVQRLGEADDATGADGLATDGSETQLVPERTT